MSTTPAINCSAVSTTPVFNPCHGVSVIASVVDTGDKFTAGDKNKDGMEVGSCQG